MYIYWCSGLLNNFKICSSKMYPGAKKLIKWFVHSFRMSELCNNSKEKNVLHVSNLIIK